MVRFLGRLIGVCFFFFGMVRNNFFYFTENFTLYIVEIE